MKMSKIWYTYLLFLNFFSAAWKKSVHQRDKQQENDMLGKAFSVIKSWHFEIGAKWTIFMEIIPWKFDKTIHYSPFTESQFKNSSFPISFCFVMWPHENQAQMMEWKVVINMITVVSSQKGDMSINTYYL